MSDFVNLHVHGQRSELDGLTRTSQQIEAARVTISRHLKRKGKLWIRVFPHKPVTKKPAETRMGQGKGLVEYYVADAQAPASPAPTLTEPHHRPSEPVSPARSSPRRR